MSNDADGWQTVPSSKKASNNKQKSTRGGNNAPAGGRSRGRKEESKNPQKKDASERNNQKKPTLNWRAEKEKLLAEVEKEGGLANYLTKRNPEFAKLFSQPPQNNEPAPPPAPVPAPAAPAEPQNVPVVAPMMAPVAAWGAANKMPANPMVAPIAPVGNPPMAPNMHFPPPQPQEPMPVAPPMPAMPQQLFHVAPHMPVHRNAPDGRHMNPRARQHHGHGPMNGPHGHRGNMYNQNAQSPHNAPGSYHQPQRARLCISKAMQFTPNVSM